MTIPAEALNESRTLRDVFGLTASNLSAGFDHGALNHAAKAEGAAFHTWMNGAGSQRLPKQMADHLCDALDVSLIGVFAGFWHTRNELRQCARETREDPSRSSEVDLADHAFVHELKVDVDVLLNSKRVATIPFVVETSCTVEALTLCLRHGAVYKVRSGRCDCEAQIRCAESVVWRHGPHQLSLPGEFALREPIAIDN
jgi:hypothetical protein